MSLQKSGRSALATVVGWTIALIVGWVLLRFVLGTLFWLLRGAILIAVIVGLVALYLVLKAPDDEA